MVEELKDIKFKYKFRDYQQDALEMLNNYINDKKIHIVAAPGAGKTILSLELLLRIGKKALILVPTIAIKEQWIERLKKDFINGDKEELISSDLDNPKIITVITYQALDAMKKQKKNIENLIISTGIKTIIFDEAHHLRKVWFKTLENITKKLDDVTTIALTATPPYDNGNDFANYMSLCGDIDAKITIPQLVKSNCLCKHHDYIYFNLPSEEEIQKLKKYNEEVNELINSLKNNKEFIKVIALNNYVINPEENATQILDDFYFYIAILSFLKEVGCNILENHFTKNIEIPKFNKKFMQIILEKYIFTNEFEECEIFNNLFKEIRQKLMKIGSIEEKKVNFGYTKELEDVLLKNAGKLDSINEIIKIEQENMQENLKMAIVTDYIKEEYYDIFDENEISEIGVIPIFRKAISQNINTKFIVLTGSFIIIPTEYKDKLLEISKVEFGINPEEIQITELGIDFNYSKVEFESKYKRYSVNIITKLFKQTEVSVLIGTAALIGEGWDAPFVNSLIMATFISSYVSSNQIRGRAIRIDKENSNKVSNIWHLVCVEKEGNNYILGQDYEILSKRFFAYDGLNLKSNTIENGIIRLNIDERKYTKDAIKELNNQTIIQSKDKAKISRKWDEILETYVPISKDEIPIEKLYKNKRGKYKNKNKGIIRLSEIGIDVGLLYLTSLGILGIETFGLIVLNRIFFDDIINSERKFIKRICKACFELMNENGLFRNEKTKFYIKKKKYKIEYGLLNANTHEQLLYIKTVKQAITLEGNSRYIVESGGRVYSVPEMFSKNKEEATRFLKKLKVAGGKLIYTKTEQGRKTLLKHKMKEFRKYIN